MQYDTATKIKDHTESLEKIYKQRRTWLYASSIVYTSVVSIIVGWEYLSYNNHEIIWWVIVTLSLIVSTLWWYWTMRTIVTLVLSIYAEYEILTELTIEIEKVRMLVKDTIVNECNTDNTTD